MRWKNGTNKLQRGRLALKAEAASVGGLFQFVRLWHLTDKPPAPELVAYWTNNGQKAALGLDLSAAIDPSATLAVHCGNGSADPSAKPVLLKAIIAMSYAHWEGYVRICSNRYFEHLPWPAASHSAARCS